LERVRTLDADVIGATESVQVQRHLQSYLLFFKPNALKSEAFWQFWSGIRASGRLVAIYRYELGLPAAMDRGGLRCATLFEVGEVENPTLSKWRDLIDRGFPYVKVAALRDNPSNQDISDWPQILRDQGYDPAIVVKHLAAPANWLRRMVVRFRL
jgi:lipopolysaccharide biosynthesis protein